MYFFICNSSSFTKKRVKVIQILGEFLVLLSFIIIFFLNVNGLSSFQDNDIYVLGKYMEGIGSAVSRIEKNQHQDKEHLIEEGDVVTLSEVEKEVVFSNKQAKIVTIFTGAIGTLGSTLLFFGRIGEYKIDKTNVKK